jgi:superfamily II DNA helicase RecQ
LGAWLIRYSGPAEAFSAAVVMFATSGAILSTLSGVGQRKLEKFGDAFLDLIDDHLSLSEYGYGTE